MVDQQKIARLQAWVNRLGSEADVPIANVGGQRLSPRQILGLLQQDDPRGEQGYHMVIPNPHIGPPLEVTPEDIAERIATRAGQGKARQVFTLLAGQEVEMTPQQQVQEILQDTPHGQRIAEAERKLIEHQIGKA